MPVNATGMRAASLLLFVFGMAVFVGCEFGACPGGTQRVGAQCRRSLEQSNGRDVDADALADAGEFADDAGSSVGGRGNAKNVTCGDGVVEGDEECDLESSSPGCRNCRIEPGYSCNEARCLPIPEPPMVKGRPSSDPEHVVWTWVLPEGAVSARVELDGEPVTVEAGATKLERALDPGRRTCAVRACNAIGGCSEPTEHTTMVERFGADGEPWLRGVRRAITSTALGRATAIACRNCYLASDGSPLPLTETEGRIGTSLTRGADLIDLDAVLIDNELYASEADDPVPGERLKLREVLERPGVAASDAAIVIRVHEVDAKPDRFAARLLNLLDELPNTAKNGRPAFLVFPEGRLPFASELQQAAARDYPLLAPYLRYWLAPSGQDSPEAWTQVVELALEHGMQGIVVDFRVAHLFTLISALQEKGLGVWIDNVPGPGDGEVVLAGLRDVVDGFFTDVRVDQARTVVKGATTMAFVNSRTHTSVEQLLPITGMDLVTGEVLYWQRQLGLAPLANSFGSPGLLRWDGPSEPFQGGVLDFSGGQRGLCVSGGPLDQMSDGVLVSVAATLGSKLSTITTDAALFSSDSILNVQMRVLGGSNGASYLMFTTSPTTSNVGLFRGIYWFSGAPSAGVCTSKNGEFTEPLQQNRVYWLMGVYDGRDRVQLFIDGRCAGYQSTTRVTGATRGDLGACLGMEPTNTTALRGTSFYQGVMQVASLLSWEPLADGAEN